MKGLWCCGTSCLLLLAAAAASLACARLGSGLHVTTGLVSHNVCSEVFVSGRDPDVAYAEILRPRPGMGLIDRWIAYAIDRERGEVVATLRKGYEARSVYRTGLGCRLNPPAPIGVPDPAPHPELGTVPL